MWFKDEGSKHRHESLPLLSGCQNSRHWENNFLYHFWIITHAHTHIQGRWLIGKTWFWLLIAGLKVIRFPAALITLTCAKSWGHFLYYNNCQRYFPFRFVWAGPHFSAPFDTLLRAAVKLEALASNVWVDMYLNGTTNSKAAYLVPTPQSRSQSQSQLCRLPLDRYHQRIRIQMERQIQIHAFAAYGAGQL